MRAFWEEPAMYQKILVPIDLADLDFAKPALAAAVSLVQSSGGAIRLINVIPMTPVMLAEYVPPDFDVQQRGSAEESLEGVARESGYDPAKVSTVVRQGGIYHEVLEEAKTDRDEFAPPRNEDLFPRVKRRPHGALRQVLGARGAQARLDSWQHLRRHRVGAERARPVAAKDIAGLPQK
jgi:hypothetical protein